LFDQVNLISSRIDNNWKEAYAELASFDFMNQDFLKEKNYLSDPIIQNHDIPNNRTFSYELGKSGNANLDGYFDEFGAFFDIKCLKDNVSEILEGIYQDLKLKINYSNLTISAEYYLDTSYEEYQKKRNELLEELVRKIDVSQKPTFVKSDIIPDLNYRLLWGSGVLSAIRTYHPHEHAKNTHRLVFNYCNKFVKDRPFFLTFVIFPWFNGIINDFNDSNIEYYRTFSRRVYCQYIHDKTRFNSFLASFGGSETMFEVSKKLSGILFLEDRSIMSDEVDTHNIKSYIYFNPNAENKLTNIPLFREFCSELEIICEDFEHDNY